MYDSHETNDSFEAGVYSLNCEALGGGSDNSPAWTISPRNHLDPLPPDGVFGNELVVVLSFFFASLGLQMFSTDSASLSA